MRFLDARFDRKGKRRTEPIIPFFSLTFCYFALQRLSDNDYAATQGALMQKNKVYLKANPASPPAYASPGKPAMEGEAKQATGR